MLLGIVTGAFTEVLLKYLKVVGLDLNDLANAVTKQMKDKYGIKQMPVSAWCQGFHKLISTSNVASYVVCVHSVHYHCSFVAA